MSGVVVQETWVFFFFELVMGLLCGDVFVGVGDAQSFQLSVFAVDAVIRLGRDLTVLLSFVLFDLIL